VLLIAAFAGLILSIPFLPPIDGGTRFYASTIPFFFALPAIVLGKSSAVFGQYEQSSGSRSELLFLRTDIIILSVMAAIIPLAILNLSSHPSLNSVSCPAGQYPFLLRAYPNSYMDLIKDNAACGLSPETCFSDFQKNGMEKNVDDFYQELVFLTDAANDNVRIIPSVNLMDGQFHFFVIPYTEVSSIQLQTVSGCASEIKTKSQSIYYVESPLNLYKTGN
jgi:hypothetical protein